MTIQEIKGDNISGANELLQKSALILNEFWQNEDRFEPDFEKRFKQLGLELIHAQPRMAPFFNLVNFLSVVYSTCNFEKVGP